MNTSVRSSKLKAIRLFCLIITPLLFAGCSQKQNTPQADIAVANSYLNAVIKDLCGDDKQVLDLVPPGMCPGHFDIKPSQVNSLCHCKHLFLFNFQQNIEKAIPRIKEQGLQVHIINPAPGLCIPETYMSIASQVADVLSAADPSMARHYQDRLAKIKTRHQNLQMQITKSVDAVGLKECRVLTSQHQKVFVKWLGLNPVSTFTSQDAATPALINKNIKQAQENDVKIIIANQQEGTEMAAAIADHLKTKFVTFSNFPGLSEQQVAVPAFDNLLIDNVARLVEVSK